jgi:hypothetical protein
VLGLTLLIYSLVTLNSTDGALAAAAGIAALVVLGAFVVVERRSRAPLVRLGMLRSWQLTGANLVALSLQAAVTSMVFFCTLYMQTVLDYTATQTGLAFITATALVLVGAATSPRLMARLGTGAALALGMVLVAAGISWLARLPDEGSYLTALAPGLALAGPGIGLVFTGTVVAATAGVPLNNQGLASGLVHTAQQIGIAIGLAVTVSLATIEGTGGTTGTPSGYRLGLVAAAVIAITGAAIATTLPRLSQSPLTSSDEPRHDLP